MSSDVVRMFEAAEVALATKWEGERPDPGAVFLIVQTIVNQMNADPTHVRKYSFDEVVKDEMSTHA